MADLIMGMLGPFLIHGNGLQGVEQGRSDKIQFNPIDWRMVTPIFFDDQDPNSAIVGWKIREGANSRETSSDGTMHLKWWSPLGQLGISPLEQVRQSILSDDMANRWANSNLAQGARPSGVVELAPEFVGLDPTEKQTLLDSARTDLRLAYGGPDNAGKLPVLPPGLTWKDAKNYKASTEVNADQLWMPMNNLKPINTPVPPPKSTSVPGATASTEPAAPDATSAGKIERTNGVVHT
jgi:phage portal protein BeeE